MLKKKYLHKHYVVTLQTSMGDIIIKYENASENGPSTNFTVTMILSTSSLIRTWYLCVLYTEISTLVGNFKFSTVIPRLTSDPANEDFFAVFRTRLTNMDLANKCFSGCAR